MTTTTEPTWLQHPSTPCPDWCDGCERYSHESWSAYTDDSWRTHAHDVAKLKEEPVLVGWGRPAKLDFNFSAVADEQFRRTLDGGLAHDDGPIRVGVHFCVEYINGSGDWRADEVSWDMTPEQADHLAEMLRLAAGLVRDIEGRRLRDLG